MARTQISEDFGKSSIFDHFVPAKVQSSMVQLGRKTTTTIDIGMLTPVDTIEVIPGDYVNLSWRYLLDSLPLAAPPYTPFRVRFHAYYARYLDLWEGASSYLTKGRNGSLNLTKPICELHVGGLDAAYASGTDMIAINSPMSLPSLLGLPSSYNSDPSVPQYRPYRNTTGHVEFEEDSSAKSYMVNKLPFMMYQKIYRRYYMPSNLLQDNKIWFPDDVTNPWRISYNSENCPDIRYFGTSSVTDSPVFSPFVPSVSDNCVCLVDVRYACYGDDTFTTALPFQVRGAPPSLDFPIDVAAQKLAVMTDSPLPRVEDVSVALNFSPTSHAYQNLVTSTSDNPTLAYLTRLSAAGTPADVENGKEIVTRGDYLAREMDKYISGSSYYANLPGISAGNASFNLNQFRQLIALSVWQERNTRTNGNYNSLIYAHFGDNPGYDDFEPRYIGGSSDVIYFNEVVQTSESSSSNPLGSVAGLGHADKTSDAINFKVPDYGYIMIIANIMPDVSYTQGLERMFTRINQEEEYFPEYNALGFQAVLNKEIFVSGDSAQDNDVFGWQERNLDFKIRRSRATGLFALPPVDSGRPTDAMFSAHVMNRYFGSLPKLSAQFVTASPDNIRRDWLAYPNLPAFKLDFATDISVRRNIPYQNVPETFGF